MNNLDYIFQIICVGLAIATFLLNTGRGVKAIEVCKECLIFENNVVPKNKEEQFSQLVSIAAIYKTLIMAYYFISDDTNAIEYSMQLLEIRQELGKTGEYIFKLARFYEEQYNFVEAGKLYEKAIKVMREIGDRTGEAAAYENLGAVFISLGEYHKAEECIEKALRINTDIDDKKGQAGDFLNLGNIFLYRGEYDNAKEYLEKSLTIRIEIGDREGEAGCYGLLGIAFQSLGECAKAKEYIEKALAINIEIGNRKGEAANLANLGKIFQSCGEFDKAKEYLEKALAIGIEIGDKEGKASCYENLGTVLQSVNEYDRAKKDYEKALEIRREIGDRKGEAANYINLGTMFGSRDEYEEAKNNFDKALAITVEIGDRAGEASCYGNLGAIFQCLGQYDEAKEHFQKGLVIRKEIGDRAGEAADYFNLGDLLHSIDEPLLAECYLMKALSITQDIGDLRREFGCLSELAMVKITQNKIQEAIRYLVLSMESRERLHAFLRDNDQFKISFSNIHGSPYRILAAVFVFLRKDPNKALYVVELARARALTDLMATRYSIARQISALPQSWIGIENIIKQESNCSCLYISNHEEKMFFWIIKTSGVIYFRTKTTDECFIAAGFSCHLDEFLATRFRSYGILPQGNCEDRSFNDIELTPDVSQEEELATLRQVRGEDDREQDLTLLYNMLIAPVADLLEGSEIIIVPDPCLYHVPFPALHDDNAKYLSETFRIRIVPSLTTLKCIQDSPTDYHSQSGVLIVGDPEVGTVRFKKRTKTFEQLPFARKEAEMIGRLLSASPLLGEKATKQVVLERVPSAGLIHFAAHGDAERGEIVLSPGVRSTDKLPREQEYLLTMSDISKVQLRAKLVVLSCCHSGRGKINAEEVIGITRAFLGSGARSVLVALWAVNDLATEQFMSRFYEHLVGGESACESLHEAMKWMRSNGWSEVKQWAPFMLIGDNVSFQFGK